MELIARVGSRSERVVIERREGVYRIAIGSRSYVVDARSLGPFVKSLLVDGESHEAAVFRAPGGGWIVGWAGRTTKVELIDPLTHLAESSRAGSDRKGKRVVTAYMPGRVVAIAVTVGDAVEAGRPLVVLEAMKMQNEIQADRAGTVQRIFVVAGQTVEGGDPLVELE